MEIHPPILVIEDDPIIARSLSRALQVIGRRSELVSSCAEVSRLVGRYSGAIIDLHLPDGNGLAAFRQLAERGLIASAVFFSATTDEEEVRQARALGVYVPKASGVFAAVSALLQTQARKSDPPESETRASTPRLPAVESAPRDSSRLKK